MTLHSLPGDLTLVRGGAAAIGVYSAGIFVAGEGGVRTYGLKGDPAARFAADANISAIARVGPWITLGYADGNVERHTPAGEKPRGEPVFKDIPSSAVVRLLAGPPGTIIVGYANGLVGLWSLKTGARLYHSQLHGPVVHLVLTRRALYAASELGDSLVLNLDELYQSYCRVLRKVWRAVPVVWVEGRAQRRALPSGHPCAGRAAPPP